MKLERKSGTDAAEWFTQLGYVTIIILLLHPRSLIINYGLLLEYQGPRWFGTYSSLLNHRIKLVRASPTQKTSSNKQRLTFVTLGWLLNYFCMLWQWF